MPPGSFASGFFTPRDLLAEIDHGLALFGRPYLHECADKRQAVPRDTIVLIGFRLQNARQVNDFLIAH